MSSTNSTQEQLEAYLDKLNFTGGYPTHRDLVPSIIFSIIYVLIIPAVIYRWIRSPSRVLIRPSLFVLVRVATYILRAIMSRLTKTFNKGEMIAELVLVSVGYLFIVSPTVDLWKRHVCSEVPVEHQPAWLTKLTRAAHITLIAAIVTAVAGASMVGNASSSDTSSTSTTLTLKKVSYVLSILVVAIVALGVVSTTLVFDLTRRGSTLLLGICACCAVVGIYRVVQVFSTDPSAPVRSLAAFYVLQCAFEVPGIVLLLVVDLDVCFPTENGQGAYRASVGSDTPMNKFEQQEYGQPQLHGHSQV